MNRIKIFTKKDCPKCPKAKELGKVLQEQGKPVEYFDLDIDSGLAEGSFHTVLATPSIIITDQDDNEIQSWRGEVPGVKTLIEKLKAP